MPLARAAAGALAAGTALAALLTAGAPPASADSTYPVPAGATSLTITGAGYGHGRGLSQYGANAAAEQGLSTDQILRHYYPGTRNGTAGGQLRVLLSTRPVLVVRTRSGLVASVAGGRRWRLTHLPSRAARQARQWSITPVSATRNRLSYRSGGRWKTFRVVSGQLQFSAANAPIRLVAGRDSGTFRGTLRSAWTAPGSTDRDIVNVVRLEDYVKGVVPNEMPALWAPAAVRAQADAARSYAVYQRTYRSHGWFDVYDTATSQVYRGAASQHRASDRAVDATRRRILTYAGRPAFTEFSSSNGGYTVANPGYPYLRSGRDAYDPVIRWSTTVPLSAFKALYPSYFPLKSVAVRTYPGAGGWVQTVILTRASDGATHDVSGADFRSDLGLRSSSFQFGA